MKLLHEQLIFRQSLMAAVCVLCAFSVNESRYFNPFRVHFHDYLPTVHTSVPVMDRAM